MAPEKTQIYNILWVENDHFHIDSLMYWVKDDPIFNVENAQSLVAATDAVKRNPRGFFDLIILDLIMSIKDDGGNAPDWFEKEQEIGANGILFLEFVRRDLKLPCPVLIMSIIDNPIAQYNLQLLAPVFYLSKVGLRPSIVRFTVRDVLGITETG